MPTNLKRVPQTGTEEEWLCWSKAADADGFISRSEWIRSLCNQAASERGYPPQDITPRWGHGLLEYLNKDFDNQKEK